MTIYTKVCTKCKIEKPITDFVKRKASKDGYCASCKSCHKQYCKDNKETIAEKAKQYRKDNKESRTQNSKQYYQDNKELIAEKRKQRRGDNKESRAEYNKQYRKDNKETIAEYNKQYQCNRRKQDPLFKLAGRIRSRISACVKQGGFTKKTKTAQILGCSFEEFKIHVESQFTEGMSWDNYGEWHYDHKTPVSWALTEEEIIALNHYTNFQPLWAKDNLSKGNRLAH